MRGPRSASMNDAAAPAPRVSRASFGSSPSASASASASAPAAMWIPHSNWLTVFMACPSPGLSPIRTNVDASWLSGPSAAA